LAGVEVYITSLARATPALEPKHVRAGAVTVMDEALRRIDAATQSTLLEPVMELDVNLTDASYAGDVVRSLNEKKAMLIETLTESGEESVTDSSSPVAESVNGAVVRAMVPLRSILKYSSEVRQLSKGHCYFWSTLKMYRPVVERATRDRLLRQLT
jgi:elongation factor G